MTLITQTPQNN